MGRAASKMGSRLRRVALGCLQCGAVAVCVFWSAACVASRWQTFYYGGSQFWIAIVRGELHVASWPSSRLVMTVTPNKAPGMLLRWPRLDPEQTGWSSRISLLIPLGMSLAFAWAVVVGPVRRAMARTAASLLRPAKWTGIALCILMICCSIVYAGRIGRGGSMKQTKAMRRAAQPSTLCRFVSARAVILCSLPVERDRACTITDPYFQLDCDNACMQWSTPSLAVLDQGVVRLVTPLWLAISISAGISAVLMFITRKRIPAGHCRGCGYDLTGNESGRCPECGRACKLTSMSRHGETPSPSAAG